MRRYLNIKIIALTICFLTIGLIAILFFKTPTIKVLQLSNKNYSVENVKGFNFSAWDIKIYDDVLYFNYGDKIFAWDIKTKKKLWNTNIELSRFGVVKMYLDKDYIFAVSDNGIYTLYRNSGMKAWYFNKQIEIIDNVYFSDKAIILAKNPDKLLALDKKSGRETWQIDTDIFLGSTFTNSGSSIPNKLIIFDEKVAFKIDGITVVVDIDTEQILWRSTKEGINWDFEKFGDTLVSTYDGSIAGNNATYLTGVDASNGGKLWRINYQQNTSIKNLTKDITYPNTVYFFLTVRDEIYNRHKNTYFIGLNSKTGEEICRIELSDASDTNIENFVRNKILYVGQNNTIYAYDISDQKKIWETDLKQYLLPTSQLPIGVDIFVHNNKLYATERILKQGNWMSIHKSISNKNLIVLDVSNGEPLWKFEKDFDLEIKTAMHSTGVYILTPQNGLYLAK